MLMSNIDVMYGSDAIVRTVDGAAEDHARHDERIQVHADGEEEHEGSSSQTQKLRMRFIIWPSTSGGRMYQVAMAHRVDHRLLNMANDVIRNAGG